MGQQSSNSKNFFTAEDALKIPKILSESPQFEVVSARKVSSKRMSEKGFLKNEFLTERQISIHEANEAIDFVHDFVLLYSAPSQNGVNMNTNPLLAFHPRTLASSETLGDSPQNLYQSIASSGGMNNKPKLLRNKVKSIIQTTEQSAAELKTVLTDMNTQQKARFSFARQRMDFHREPAKLAKVVGSGSGNNKLHESYRDNRDTFGSHNNSLSQALQARGAMRSSGIDQVREVRNVKSRNSPDQMRETGIREVQNGRSRNSPDQMKETGVRNMRSRNSPEQMRDNSAPVFGDVIRESREYRDDNNYESKRREKKERDNKTHESLLVLKDDIDRIKGDLQRSKSTTREPRRSNDRPTYRDGSPGLSSYQGLTRDAKNTRDDPYDNRRQPQYEQQKQSRNRMEPAENEYNQRQGGRYNQPPSINIPPQYNTAGPDMTQSQQYNRNMNPQQYPKKETFGKNDDPGRAMKFSQAQAQNPNNQYYDNNGRPKSPLTADFAAYKRNDYEKQTMARSQTPVHDARGGNPPSYRDQGLAYSSPNLTPQNQNRIPQQVKKLDNNNRYISEPNYNSMNGEREQGLNYGQMNVQKNRSDNYHSQPQPQTQPQPKNTVPNQYGHQNLLNLLTPQKNNNNNKSQANNDMNFMNTPRSKHNFSGIVSDVNGSYSFDDDNEVQPVSINLNLEDLLNDSQIQINNGVPQKSNKNGYQQPSQANYSKVNHSSTRNDPPYPPHPNQNRFQNQNNYQQSQNNYNSIPKTHYVSSSGYQGQNRQERNYDPRQYGDNTVKNDAYMNRSIERDEPVRRSKWDVNHHDGYNSARGQLQSNYNYTNSGQIRKY